MHNVHIDSTLATFEVGRGKERLLGTYKEGVFSYTSNLTELDEVDTTKLVSTDKLREIERIITNAFNSAFKENKRVVWGYESGSYKVINYFRDKKDIIYRRVDKGAKGCVTSKQIGVSYVTEKGKHKVAIKKVSKLYEWLPSLNEKVLVGCATGTVTSKALNDYYWVYLDSNKEVLVSLLKMHPIKGIIYE